MVDIFKDVPEDVGERVWNGCVDIGNFCNIPYADDTILVRRRSWDVSKIIPSTEKASKQAMYLVGSLLKRLDAFQMTGIRHIMGIGHTSWSRCSNENIVRQTVLALRASGGINGLVDAGGECPLCENYFRTVTEIP